MFVPDLVIAGGGHTGYSAPVERREVFNGRWGGV
jgi:hypothetical protein